MTKPPELLLVEAQRRVDFCWQTCRPDLAERWAVVTSKPLGKRRITRTLLAFSQRDLAEAALAGLLKKRQRRKG